MININLKNKLIKDAAIYYVKELVPLYDKSYKLSIELGSFDTEKYKELKGNEKNKVIIEHVKHNRKINLSIDNIQSELKEKRSILDKIMSEFSGSEIVAVDNEIKKLRDCKSNIKPKLAEEIKNSLEDKD